MTFLSFVSGLKCNINGHFLCKCLFQSHLKLFWYTLVWSVIKVYIHYYWRSAWAMWLHRWARRQVPLEAHRQLPQRMRSVMEPFCSTVEHAERWHPACRLKEPNHSRSIISGLILAELCRDLQLFILAGLHSGPVSSNDALVATWNDRCYLRG